ncbi:hypothetical protein SAMN05421827_12837 [Pedobacter terrae]|uniref:Uncharacterized protein n=2 Tax=Pedobacter terrae TaxID=405671 RepID=A0A1G8D8N5_9SPHI|nr:hypothetical protein SAMN05421827_12837 [Pedobacter terrae]
MFLIGFIKNDEPRTLINPVMCRNETEVYTWLASFFNDENFSLDKPITQQSVTESLSDGAPVLVPINGYSVAIMFGEDGAIQNSTERFVHTDLFNYEDYMAN